MPFNLRGCQAKEVAESILYILGFCLSSEVKRLFSNLEPQTCFMIKLAHSVHSHTWTLEGNCHSPLQLIAKNLILPGSWKLHCLPWDSFPSYLSTTNLINYIFMLAGLRLWSIPLFLMCFVLSWTGCPCLQLYLDAWDDCLHCDL